MPSASSRCCTSVTVATVLPKHSTPKSSSRGPFGGGSSAGVACCSPSVEHRVIVIRVPSIVHSMESRFPLPRRNCEESIPHLSSVFRDLSDAHIVQFSPASRRPRDHDSPTSSCPSRLTPRSRPAQSVDVRAPTRWPLSALRRIRFFAGAPVDRRNPKCPLAVPPRENRGLQRAVCSPSTGAYRHASSSHHSCRDVSFDGRGRSSASYTHQSKLRTAI